MSTDDDDRLAAEEPFVREQLVRAHAEWLAAHARPDGTLRDLTEQADLLLIAASQVLDTAQGSPLARARVAQALARTGVYCEHVRSGTGDDDNEDDQPPHTPDHDLTDWWTGDLLPPYHGFIGPKEPRP